MLWSSKLPEDAGLEAIDIEEIFGFRRMRFGMSSLKPKTASLATLIIVALTACKGWQLTSPALPDFSSAYSITILDDWDGLSPDAPINSYYAIEKSDDLFEGAALFTIGGNWAKKEQTSSTISIPGAIIQSFLQTLAGTHPENGDYQPNFQHTDDYPDITIRLVYGNEEIITFHTTSQGDQHIPWQVTFSNQSYVVNSGIPAKALEILMPYLAQYSLQNLDQQVLKQSQ